MQIKELLHSDTEFDIVPRIPNTNSVFSSTQSSSANKNDELEKSLDTSQISTVETPSKTFNYSVATKRIPEGSAPGRKVDKKSKINHSEGQLSLNSDGNTLSNSNKSPIKSLLLVSSSCCKAVTLGGIVELAICDKLIGIEVEEN